MASRDLVRSWAVSRSRKVRGFTLLELIVSVAIGALLVSLVVMVSSTFSKRAKKVKCIANMRVLHGALSDYLADKRSWPQMEEGRYDFKEEEFFRFWITATEPYGMSQESWQCPSDRLIDVMLGDMEVEFFGSYNVTRFDSNPSTPYRWNQPWAMERGNFHGNGAHILLPDGSVTESANPFYGR